MPGKSRKVWSLILVMMTLSSCLGRKDSSMYNPVDECTGFPAGTGEVKTVYRNALRTNSDTFGAVMIPGTPLCLPVMKSGDPEEYLRKDIRGDRSVRGTPFVIFEEDDPEKVLIICGHYYVSGEVFGTVHMFLDDPMFLAEHQSLLFCNEDGVKEYSILGSSCVSSAELAEAVGKGRDGLRKLFGANEIKSSLIVLVTCMDYRGSGDRRVLWAVGEW